MAKQGQNQPCTDPLKPSPQHATPCPPKQNPTLHKQTLLMPNLVQYPRRQKPRDCPNAWPTNPRNVNQHQARAHSPDVRPPYNPPSSSTYFSPCIYFLIMFNSSSIRRPFPPEGLRELISDFFMPKGNDALGLSKAGWLSGLSAPPPECPPSRPGFASFLLVVSFHKQPPRDDSGWGRRGGIVDNRGRESYKPVLIPI